MKERFVRLRSHGLPALICWFLTDRILFLSANVEALASGESEDTPCGGTKSEATGNCKSENTVNCKDLSGCN